MLNAGSEQSAELEMIEHATGVRPRLAESVVWVPHCRALSACFAAGLLLSSFACKSAPASEAAPIPPNPPKLEMPVQAAEPAKASAETEAYSVALKAPASVKAGVSGTLELTVTPKAPFHCNMEYPYKLKLEPNPALNLSGEPITKDAFQIASDCTKLQIPFTAAKAGNHVVTGQLSFSVCKDDQCLVERQALSVAIAAE